MKITHASEHGGLDAVLYMSLTYREFAFLKTLVGSTYGGIPQGTAQTVYQDMHTIPWGYVDDGVCKPIALLPGHQEHLNEFEQP